MTSRGGRPRGSISVPPDRVIRQQVHLTVNRQRQPLFAEWLTRRRGRGLAGELVMLVEQALAGQNVALSPSGGGEQVVEIDLSGLAEWE